MSDISKEQIIRTYNRLVDKHNGRVIGERVFLRESDISRYWWNGGYWRSWSAFVEDAGHQPNDPQSKTPDDLILERFAELTRELNKIPTDADVMIKKREDSTFPSRNTYKRWGGRDALLEKVIDFCESKDGFNDVLEILNRGVSDSTNSRLTSNEVSGFVYLIRSGKNYKIGRTNAIGRRLNELAIQLPQKPDTVHVIETDDPEGIEQYWHRRFAEKRKDGEWFSLSAKDVAAFKRRKFQ